MAMSAEFDDACCNNDKVTQLLPETSTWKGGAGGSYENNGTPEPYPDVWGIPHAYRLFHLNGVVGGINPARLDAARNTVRQHIETQKRRFLGYQSNMTFDGQQYISPYFDASLNNAGDAFTEGNSTVNTKFMERAVLDYYATLWHGKAPHSKDDPESYWGFLLTMGSTEGNLFAMWSARDYLSGGRKLPLLNTDANRRSLDGIVPQSVSISRSENAFTPIAFYSDDTHYCIAKAMNMLGIRTFYAEGSARYPGQCPLRSGGTWPLQVPSNDDGSISIAALKKLVEFFASRGYPIIVNYNYGSTYKGAYDDVEGACGALRPILEEYGLYERKVRVGDDPEVYEVRTGYWFHVDGALGAAYMPYVEMAYDRSRSRGSEPPKGADKGAVPVPVFDFRLPMVHSISMSGHKWIGAPMPSGVYMTRTKYKMRPPQIPEIVGPDTTFAGSRNGLSALILWDHLARHSLSDHIHKSLHLLQLAAIAEQKLRHLQDDVLKHDLWVERSRLSLAVRFKRVNNSLCKKYSIANETIKGRAYSHIFAMEHVTEELLDEFVEDLRQPGAFVDTTAAPPPPPPPALQRRRACVKPCEEARSSTLATAFHGFKTKFTGRLEFSSSLFSLFFMFCFLFFLSGTTSHGIH